MSDPLAEVITMLKLRAVLSKTVTGAGEWRVRRSDYGQSFYCAILEGACHLEIEGHEPLTLVAGDFILIPAAYNFAMTSLAPPAFHDATTTPVETSPGHFRLGSQHDAVEMVALPGHCAADASNASLLVSLLPAFVLVRNEPRLGLLLQLLKDEAQAQRSGKEMVLTRIIELLFIEAIRATGTLATPGLMRGLSDARIAQAIRASEPAKRWTVKALAERCALSRSVLFARFTALTGVTPMAYLLSWRMTLAMQLLDQRDTSMAGIAERTGYNSASAFSVAFTRYVGVPPGKYAQQGRIAPN